MISVLGTGQYSLFINGERMDETEGLHGIFTLRGRVPADGGGDSTSVIVRIDQKVTSTGYVLEVAGEQHEMTTS
ncbi:hypothetical protein [Iamia sp.]|uniref:hypothetical protein n=1 Tax=Iamia sp. TaxID=2722710 RepID=UPI002C58ADE3|nr:hypothetical protein [Iamia sp.]HXH56783.1 hypothetical protein [Iamia sp.]